MGSLSDEFKSRADEYALQRAKFEALRDALGNYGNFKYVNWYDFLDPDNQNWNDYTYKTPGGLFSTSQGRVGAGSSAGIFINNIRNAKTINDVYKQSELWNSYDPLSSYDRARKYFRLMFGGKEPDPVQATAGDAQGAQGVVTVGGTGTQGVQAGGTNTGGTGDAQGAQAGVQAGAGVVKGGTQGTQGVQAGGTSGIQGAKTGNASAGKPRMSDDEIDAFLEEELGGDTTGGTYASSGIPKGGTKTIGYNPIDEWNREHGISYNTGKDGVIYRTDPQHPNGYVDPFKNDLSTWTRATRSGSTYASPSISTGGTYATGEGIKDANGNVLTNPGGGADYQYALRHPEYGLVIRGRMSEPQKDYLQAVSNNMGYNYNF